MRTPSLLYLSTLLLSVECAQVDVEGCQREFLANGTVSGSLFNLDNWHLHTPQLFSLLRVEHAERLIAHFVGQTIQSSRDEARWDLGRARAYVEKITPQDIQEVKQPGLCTLFVRLLQYNTNAFAVATGVCAEDLVVAVNQRSDLIQYLPPQILINSPNIVPRLGSNLFLLPQPHLELILSNVEVCKRLDADNVKSLNRRTGALLITPKCFAALKGLENHTFAHIAEFKSDILKYLGGPINDATLALLTAMQVSSIGVSSPNENVCGQLNLTKLSSSNASGLQSSCFADYLESKGGGQTHLSFNGLWSSFPDDIFKDVLNDDPSLLSAIAPEDYERMSKRHVESILASSEACRYVPAHAEIRIDEEVKIGKTCFANLPPALQPRILLQLSDPSDSILSRVNAEMMEQWSVMHAGLEFKGFHVLRLALRQNPNIMEMMSTAHEGKHACHSIPSITELLEEEMVVDGMTMECAEALKFPVHAKDCTQHPMLWILKNYHLITLGKCKDFSTMASNMNGDHIEALMESKNFCSKLRVKDFRALSNEAKAAFTADCFVEFSFKEKMKASDFEHLNSRILAKLDAQSFGRLKWMEIPPEQLSWLSSELAVDQLSALTLLTATMMSTWTVDMMEALQKPHWDVIPPTTFQGINPKYVPQLSPEVITMWSGEQMEELHRKAKESLTFEQVEAICKMESSAPARAIAPFKRRLNQKSQKLLDERLAAESNMLPIILWTSASIAFLVIISYLFWKFFYIPYLQEDLRERYPSLSFL